MSRYCLRSSKFHPSQFCLPVKMAPVAMVSVWILNKILTNFKWSTHELVSSELDSGAKINYWNINYILYIRILDHVHYQDKNNLVLTCSGLLNDPEDLLFNARELVSSELDSDAKINYWNIKHSVHSHTWPCPSTG